jgi:hypothetical protein
LTPERYRYRLPTAMGWSETPVPRLTLQSVKDACIAATKRTRVPAVQAVVMAHGGKVRNKRTGKDEPSLLALPPEQFAACIEALRALPYTRPWPR